MSNVECDRHALLYTVDNDPSISNHSIRPAEVLEPSHGSNAGGISDVSIIVDNMDISADAPAANTLKDAERFCVESVGMTDDTVEDIGSGSFEIIGSVLDIVRI